LELVGLVGSWCDIALITSRTSRSSVMESMSKVPSRICWETSFHSCGPRCSAMGLEAKGVLDAWEKCSLPCVISAS
jgi:hypothetical protein